MFISSSQPLEEAGAVIITVLQPEKLRPGKDESPPEVSTSTRQSPGLTHRPDAKPMLAAMAQGRVGPGGFPGSGILTKRQDETQVDKQRLKGIK